MSKSRDLSLDALLPLDGEMFFVDPDGLFHVRFIVKQVPASSERPHGLSYTLTLHNRAGERLIGFDNAHPIQAKAGPGGTQRNEHDHRHRFKTVRPYDYTDAATLLVDFWQQVDSVLKEEGILP